MYKALFSMGIRTGFRISELLSITWKQVLNQDLTARNSVEIPKRRLKDKNASRRIPLHAEAKMYLEEWAKKNQVIQWDSRAFPIHRSTADRTLRNIIVIAGVDASAGKVATHALRKTFAKKMYNALGKDIFKLQEAMGHAQISNTVRYLRINEEEIEEAILNVK